MQQLNTRPSRHTGRGGVVSPSRGRTDRGRDRARFALLRPDHLRSGGRRPQSLCSGKRLGAEIGALQSGRCHGVPSPLDCLVDEWCPTPIRPAPDSQNDRWWNGEGGGSCSILARRDETLLRLDHSNIGRALERRRKWFARTPRPPDGAEPILQTRRRDEPE